MNNKFIAFIKHNTYIFLYVLLSLFIEFFASFLVSGELRISQPGIFLTLVAIAAGVLLLIRNQKARFYVSAAFLIAHAVADLVFILMYTLTSGTIFDFEMFNLTKDGMGTIEATSPNFAFLFVSCFLIGLYIVLGHYKTDRLPLLAKTKTLNIAVSCLLCLVLVAQGTIAYFRGSNRAEDLTYKLYETTDNSYAKQGILGNFVTQLYKGLFFNDVELGDTEELENYIYGKVTEPTEKFGEAAGMNTVTILAESFEWFAFLSDSERYPNGLTADEATLRILFPNLYELYDTSYIADNFHSREKTDISENLSLLGCYPTDAYVNYTFPDNALPFSSPQVLKELTGAESGYFHNGLSDFYNRHDYYTESVKIDKFFANEEMVDYSEKTGGSYVDYTEQGERNLDSDMIDLCKEEMFPSDRRFDTHISTITMHGQYADRENLKENYELLDKYGVCPVPDENDKHYKDKYAFRTYVAAAMELDKAVGEIFDYLENTKDKNGVPLIENTIVVLFGDHNAYYYELSDYIKDLPDTDTGRRYTDLFRVPLMIRVGNKLAGKTAEERKIDKFTCTADIVPTIYDLLGVKYFENMLYGHSIFSDKTSVLYSRAYDVFITEKMYFYNLNNIIWQENGITQAYIDEVEETAVELLEKTSHMNRIYYNDYFRGEKSAEFKEKLRDINA